MGKLTVVARLGWGFGVILVFLMCVSLLGLYGMSQMGGMMRDISQVNNVEIKLVSSLRNALTSRAIIIRNIALLDDAEAMRLEEENLHKQEKNYAAAYAALMAKFASESSTTEQEHALMRQLKKDEEQTVPLMAKALQLGKGNDTAGAVKVLIADVRPRQAAWVKTLGELSEFEDQLNEQATTAAESTYQTLRGLTLSVMVVALLLGLIAAYLIARSIIRQLGAEPAQAQLIARDIAAGDLTAAVSLRPGDQGSLMASIEQMRAQLNMIVNGIKSSAETISVASSEIAQGNFDLSQRTEEQAASLEETAASMEELTTAVRQNTHSAVEARTLSVDASGIALSGSQAFEKVVETMERISASSSKMFDIIGVIEGIAFQTNILALNAAVEAARAGEDGRGFAVVASEVRSLAQRSANASKEIKDLINESVEHVNAGSDLVSQAGNQMANVVNSVQRFSEIMNDIAGASSEQSTGIEQVNTSIVQMDQVTQQNAALVEQASAAAQALAFQASGLLQAVAIFKIHGQETVSPQLRLA